MRVRRSVQSVRPSGRHVAKKVAMARIHHSIRLMSQRGYGSEAPPIPVGTLLRQIPSTLRQAILMGFVGRSKLPGRPPTWLGAASDVRFVGFDGAVGGDTVLHFEAPTLGEAAEELYRQPEFWPSKPRAEDTGFDLLGDVIGDVAAHRADSDRYDSSLLSASAVSRRFSTGRMTVLSSPATATRTRVQPSSIGIPWRTPGGWPSRHPCRNGSVSWVRST